MPMSDTLVARPLIALEKSWEYGLVEALVGDEPAENVRALRGPHHDAFDGMCASLTAAVTDIVPNAADIDFHQPARYVTEAQLGARRRAFKEAGRSTHYDVDQELRAFRQQLGLYGKQVAWSREGQEVTLPNGVLDKPRFVRQYGGMACTAACISMLFQDITGERVHGWRFEKSMSERMGIVAESSEYSKLFDGELFRDLFGVEVSQLEITGASLGVINRIAQKARSRLPNSRVFCSVPLQSDAFPDTWHHAILLHDEDKTITLLDPKADLFPQGRQIGKSEFYRRWAAGFFRAHMYIAVPTEVFAPDLPYPATNQPR